ncbi:MAG: carotenoid oxygenase family protein, partial [Streptosporangiaceae bacterium]
MSSDLEHTMHGMFAPLLDEHDYQVDQIDGEIPRELSGTLYRIGAGKWQVGDTMLDCLFDGDGMVSQFSIADGRVRFRNRYVRTPQYVHGLTSSKLRRPGVGTAHGRIPLPPANTANTNLSWHAGDLLALWEGGRPYKIDPDTLETHGEHDFGGRLKGLGMWSAHPRWDPDTGEMFNFGTRLFPTPGLHCYRVSAQGVLKKINSFPLQGIPWNHDFALTRTHLVFVLDPIQPDLRKVFGGSFFSSLTYHPERATRFVLVPRTGGPPRVIEHEALLHFHLTNAYEDGTDTVVDLVRFEDWEEFKLDLSEFRTRAHRLPASRLMRYRITPSKVVEEELVPHTGDFPQYDWRLSTRRHRYTYLAGRTGTTGTYDSTLKVDHDSGRVTAHRIGAGNSLGEPLFVPRGPDAAEDDGWLLVVNYSETEHRSQLVILDAADLDRAPLAVVQLPHHLPFGFHGTFRRAPTAGTGRLGLSDQGADDRGAGVVGAVGGDGCVEMDRRVGTARGQGVGGGSGTGTG